MGDIKFSFDDLERRSYRDLQQLAKSLSLPSNVKKIYLIQLIHAKKFKTPSEVASIVERVRFERQRLSQARKRPSKRRTHLQGTEISSTSSTQSPPIITTPKRPGQIIIQCSPDIRQSIMTYSRPSMLRPFVRKQYTSPRTNPSDRVLRSFSMKPKTLSNTILNVVKTQNPESPKERSINIVSQAAMCPKLNFTAKCMVKKHRPNIIQSQRAGLASQQHNQLVPVTNRMEIFPSVPAKRNRTLSGIYPIATRDTPKVSYEYIQSVGFRRSDGTISKINALVQKTLNKEPPQNYRNIEMTVQDLINSNVTQNVEYSHENIPSVQYPNMSGVTDFEPNCQRQCNHFEFPERNYDKDNQDSSVYYHKKIRAEQVRSQRRVSVQRDLGRAEERLPKIHDVFSKFRDVHGRDVTQPIYVQVSEESERILNYPLYTHKANTSSTTLLESLYNFKSQFLLSQPLLQIATTSATRCVFSTPLIATPMAQTSTVAAHDTCNVSSCERDSQSSLEQDGLPRMHDFLKMAEQEMSIRRDCGEVPVKDFSTSGSSLDRSNSQALGSSATIPEMVEDALEIISQDGDYMERIGMDVRVQCILCSWAGPRFILEYHIRKEHSSQIYRPERGECSVTYALGSLVRQQLWLSQLIERQAALYVLSAKYEPPDCFMATLSMLSSDATPKTGELTIYNKVSGEPHSWSGEIQPLSPNLPYYTETTALRLSISNLDLLPNSANLKVLNRELVIKSPGRIIVGRPELDDIHLVLYVKIVD